MDVFPLAGGSGVYALLGVVPGGKNVLGGVVVVVLGGLVDVAVVLVVEELVPLEIDVEMEETIEVLEVSLESEESMENVALPLENKKLKMSAMATRPALVPTAPVGGARPTAPHAKKCCKNGEKEKLAKESLL